MYAAVTELINRQTDTQNDYRNPVKSYWYFVNEEWGRIQNKICIVFNDVAIARHRSILPYICYNGKLNWECLQLLELLYTSTLTDHYQPASCYYMYKHTHTAVVTVPYIFEYKSRLLFLPGSRDPA